MRIKKIKWDNHPILANLELDFINTETNLPYNTVVIVGENGTGKTTILKSISTFLNLGSFKHIEYLKYIANDGQDYEAIKNTNNIIRAVFKILKPDGSIKTVNSNRNTNTDSIASDITDPRQSGCVYSKARADYKTERITSTTTKQLDTGKYDDDNDDNFKSLKQLIVDIENQDNANYSDTNRALGSNPKSWDEFAPTSKIYRFKSAFDNFFENMKYDKVVDQNSEKTILFNKNNKSIDIDSLSTGEKQIVFRGIYLLRNNENLDGATVFIDEPELSMHPKWEKKILNYYKELFTTSGSQKAQLFIASHSEHILKDALSNRDDNLVIILSEVGGVIQAKRVDSSAVLPSITAAEVNYLAFDIVSSDYHIQLYGYIQVNQGFATIKECDDYIKTHQAYNATLHSKDYTHRSTTYNSLSSYIRNCIDHPDARRSFTDEELRTSIELLITIIQTTP